MPIRKGVEIKAAFKKSGLCQDLCFNNLRCQWKLVIKV